MTTLLLAATLLAAAPAGPLLNFTGPWTVDTAEKTCRLARSYAGTGGPITLAIRASLAGLGHEIYVIKPLVRPIAERWGDAHVILGDGKRAGPFAVQAFDTSARKRLARFMIEPKEFDWTKAGKVLTLDLGREGEYTFSVPALEKGLASLNACAKDLRQSYGIEPALLDSIVENPKIEKLGLTTDDYPEDAVRSLRQGDTAVLAWAEIDGRVTGCRIIQSSGLTSFDQITCSAIERRTKFKPARNAQGKAMRAPVYIRVNWRIPSP